MPALKLLARDGSGEGNPLVAGVRVVQIWRHVHLVDHHLAEHGGEAEGQQAVARSVAAVLE